MKRNGRACQVRWFIVALGSLIVKASCAPLPLRIAAHYYPWYDQGRWQYGECVAGTLRGQLAPAQEPLLGAYDSGDAQVIERHLEWCSQYNIGVLILEFYGPGTRADRISRNSILAHPHAGSVEFSVLYDWAIRFGSFEITPARLDVVRSDFAHLARFYFSSPSYLRSPDGRPVALLYVTRALQGDMDAFIRTMREATEDWAGVEPFLVGDEFFFIGSAQSHKIARWDAIFGYDVYGSRGGYWAETTTLELFLSRAAAFHSVAAQSGTVFFPSLMPGFNDRAVRRTCANNPAAARRTAAQAGPISLFQTLFDRMLDTELDSAFPVVCITSFNEWHEDTQIEPTAGGGATTTLDTSGSRVQYTQGLPYDDYGFAYLEFIRDRTVAVTGLVRRDGVPVPGASVAVADAGVVLARASADSFGRFKVPRAGLGTQARTVLLQATDGEGAASQLAAVELDSLESVTVDLDLAPIPQPELGLQLQGADLVLACPTAEGLCYLFLESGDLIDWRPFGERECGTGALLERLVPTGSAQARYWKVLVEPELASSGP